MVGKAARGRRAGRGGRRGRCGEKESGRHAEYQAPKTRRHGQHATSAYRLFLVPRIPKLSVRAHSSARHGDALHGCPESTRKPCRPLTSPLRRKATTSSALRRRPPQSFTPSQSSPRRTMGKDRSIRQAQTTRPIASWERRMSVLVVRLRPKATSSLVVGKYVCSAFSTYELR